MKSNMSNNIETARAALLKIWPHGPDSAHQYARDAFAAIDAAIAELERLVESHAREIKHYSDAVDKTKADYIAEIYRLQALANAAICGQNSLHSDLVNRWNDMRDVVLHGLDGFDNDQTNSVLSCIDDHFPSDIKPSYHILELRKMDALTKQRDDAIAERDDLQARLTLSTKGWR